jgi:hypothetical protein
MAGTAVERKKTRGVARRWWWTGTADPPGTPECGIAYATSSVILTWPSFSTAFFDEPIHHLSPPGPSCQPSIRTAQKESIAPSPHHCSVINPSELSLSNWEYTPQEKTLAVVDRTGTAVGMMPIVTETKQQHLKKANCLLQQLQGVASEFPTLREGIDEITRWIQKIQITTGPCMRASSATAAMQAELSENWNTDHSGPFLRGSQDVRFIEQVDQMIKSLESHLVMLDVSEEGQMYLKLGRLLERLKQANSLLESNSSLSAPPCYAASPTMKMSQIF